MLSTHEIAFNYDQNTSFKFPNLSVGKGESLLLLGNSGTGKTTLLHILAGLLPPNSGEVLLDSQSLYALSGPKLDAFRGKNISVIFQKPHFIQSISAIKNLEYAQKFSKEKIDTQLPTRLLQNLQIEHQSNSLTFEMSQGEQQRLSIARALVNLPKLILADEPTSALDDKNCKIVFNLLEQQAQEVNAALIIVTHDQRLKDLVENAIVI